MSLLFFRFVFFLFQKHGSRAQGLRVIFIVESFLFKNRFFLRDLFRGLFPFSGIEVFQDLFDPGDIFRGLCFCLFCWRFRYGSFFLAHQGFPFKLFRSAQGAKFRPIVDLCATTNTLHELLLLKSVIVFHHSSNPTIVFRHSPSSSTKPVFSSAQLDALLIFLRIISTRSAQPASSTVSATAS